MLEARKVRLLMQLRQKGITDQKVLSAIEKVPREAFIPESFHDQAYENTALPIGLGQTISQPSVVGFMTQALEVGPRMKVLEIGTGCGYQAAVLSGMCRRIYSIERFKELFRLAQNRLSELRFNNVTIKWGDGLEGWPEQAPFDRMILTAGIKELPNYLFDQMADDGIVIAPIGKRADEQKLVKFTRQQGGGWNLQHLWPVRFVPLLEGKIGGSSNL